MHFNDCNKAAGLAYELKMHLQAVIFFCKHRRASKTTAPGGKKSLVLGFNLMCEEDLSSACMRSCWGQLSPSPLTWATVLWESCHPDHISPDWRGAHDPMSIERPKIHILVSICYEKRKFFTEIFSCLAGFLFEWGSDKTHSPDYFLFEIAAVVIFRCVMSG